MQSALPSGEIRHSTAQGARIFFSFPSWKSAWEFSLKIINFVTCDFIFDGAGQTAMFVIVVLVWFVFPGADLIAGTGLCRVLQQQARKAQATPPPPPPFPILL